MGFGTTKTPGKNHPRFVVRFFRVLSCLLLPNRQTTEFGSGRIGRREDATRRSRSARTKHACARGDDGRVVRERERAAEELDETDDEADADGWTKG